ncbi:MAG: hypothetical protein R3F65_27960 [bacterium]
MKEFEGRQPAHAADRRKASIREAEEARLTLANGGESEASRLGFALVGAGVTATMLGVIDGLARRGKAQWWGGLAPYKRALVLLAFCAAAGFVATARRRGGHFKSAYALEAAAIAAWTLAIVYLTQSAVGGSDGWSLRGMGALRVTELKALDAQIDDDIRSAAERLRTMAEEERRLAEEEGEEDVGVLHFTGDGEEVGALMFGGEVSLDDDDDNGDGEDDIDGIDY